MISIIDAPQDLSGFIPQMKAEGVQTIIRYYNRQNSSVFPSKRLSQSEAADLTDAGFSLAVVFQQRGGAGGNIQDLDRESGKRDADKAVELADKLGQPAGSAIYFAVDHDFFRQSELSVIIPYFEEVRNALGSTWRAGSYGSGTIGKTMKSRDLIDLIWLSGSTGFHGTRDMLATDEWTMFQSALDKRFPGAGFPYDANRLREGVTDLGQFRLDGAAAPVVPPRPTAPGALMEVVARSGLRLRTGPGAEFPSPEVLPNGTVVHALGRNGDWVKVDLQGDGSVDGFVHGDFLRLISGTIPE